MVILDAFTGGAGQALSGRAPRVQIRVTGDARSHR